MYKKGDFGDFGMIAKIAFVTIVFVIILFVFFGKDQLFAKSTKPIGETAGGLSSDYDNDGIVDSIDSCPCDANQEKDAEGKCSTPSDTCRKEIEEKRKSQK